MFGSRVQERPVPTIVVRAEWDPEAHVFVVTESDDVPGLVAEAPTLDELQAKLRILIPELLELNGGRILDEAGPLQEVPLFVVSEQVGKVRLRA
jgi:hypothetical protein